MGSNNHVFTLSAQHLLVNIHVICHSTIIIQAVTRLRRLIRRRRCQLPTTLRRPVGMEFGEIEQGWIPPERIFAVRLEISVYLVPIRTREELDRRAFGVGIILVRRRHVAKVESTTVSERERTRETHTQSRRCA